MRKKAKKFFATMLAGSMIMNALSFNTFAVENSSNIQIVEQGGKEYYLADPDAGELAGPDNFDVWTSKTIEGTENEDEFEITLQVGTTMKAVPNDVAVVLVVDTSGSMMWDENGNKWENGNVPEGKKLRIEYAREAALQFAEDYVAKAGNAQRMISVVEFGSNAYAPLQWTNANDNGTLVRDVRETLEAIDVNFKYDDGISFWNPEKAIKDFEGNIGWDEIIYKPEMADKFEDCSQSFCETKMETRHSGLVVASPANASPANASRTTTLCTVDGCDIRTEHVHCSECDRKDTHQHCAALDCTVVDNTVDHVHCSKCDITTEHKHCAYENCQLSDEGHTHCKECGKTDTHTHVVGCTVSGCTDTTEGHKHFCVYGGHATYDDYYNNYRCLRTDPAHTHEMYDGDSVRTLEDRYIQKFRSIGTNMEGGLLLARNLVDAGHKPGGAIEGIDDVYVIVLSDGNPTFYVKDNSKYTDETVFVSGLHGGFSTTNWSDVVDIVKNDTAEGETDIAIAEDIKEKAKLYAILYGTSMEQKFEGKTSHALSDATGAEWFRGTDVNYVGADAVFDSPEAGGLNTVFAEIKDRIDMLAKAWVVTDELGGLVLGDDVTFKEFTENGEFAAVVPSADDQNSTISWTLGGMTPESGNGTMEKPYVYTLKYKVTLNSSKDNVKETSLAHDAGTSTEAVWTNNSAILKYFMIEEKDLDNMTPEQINQKIRSAEFAKPSVKGIYGDFEFTKKHGETKDVIEGAGFTLYDASGKAYGGEVFSNAEGKVVFTDIPRGEYTLKESTLPDGMQEPEEIGLKVSWGQVTKSNGKTLDANIYNWPEGVTPTSEPEETTPTETTPTETTPAETSPAETTTAAEETRPTYVQDDDDDNEPETTPQPTTTVPETSVEVITETVPATEPETLPSLPYVDPSWEPEDIPQEVIDTYYEHYIRGDIDLDDIPVGVLGAFFEKGFPIAVLPATGDLGIVWAMISIVSAIGLALTVLFDRKRRDA